MFFVDGLGMHRTDFPRLFHAPERLVVSGAVNVEEQLASHAGFRHSLSDRVPNGAT